MQKFQPVTLPLNVGSTKRCRFVDRTKIANRRCVFCFLYLASFGVKTSQHLLKAKADANAVSGDNVSLLYKVVERGDVQCLKLLLDAKASPNRSDQSRRECSVAMVVADFEILQMILGHLKEHDPSTFSAEFEGLGPGLMQRHGVSAQDVMEADFSAEAKQVRSHFDKNPVDKNPVDNSQKHHCRRPQQVTQHQPRKNSKHLLGLVQQKYPRNNNVSGSTQWQIGKTASLKRSGKTLLHCASTELKQYVRCAP
mgnify:CR=1 FL=1